MGRKLIAIGKSLGIVIEKSILDELGIDENTLLEITVDHGEIRIRPIGPTNVGRIRATLKRVSDRHSSAFEKLAKSKLRRR